MNNAYRKLDEMEEYVYHHGCRQQYILDYFGDFESSNCDSCDNCLGKHEKHRYDEDYRQKEYLSRI
jgi:superfamily II DNA helicase RecQ